MLNSSAVLSFLAAQGCLRQGVLPPEVEHAANTLTQADLDDYKKRLGEKSPTSSDAMMFAALSMKLSKRLPPSVLKRYNDAILKLKKIKDDEVGTAASIIADIESKALNEDPKEIKKMADQLSKQNLFYNHGQRVRLREGHRCGTVDRPDMKSLLFDGTSGAQLDIRFDDTPGEETTKIYECDLQVTELYSASTLSKPFPFLIAMI